MLSGAEEISAASQEIATGAESQSKTLHDALEQLKSMADQMTSLDDAADDISSSAANVVRSVDDGRTTIGQVHEHMNLVSDSMDELSGQVETLRLSASDIDEIVDIITAVASQSRLLALNASIEAARAGENGRGFGVVANEMGKLAEQSRSSALDIRNIVQSIQGQVEVTVNRAKVNQGVVSDAKDSVKVSSTHFARILETVNSVTTAVLETKSGIDALRQKSELLMGYMEGVVQISTNSVGGAQEVAAAIQEQTASLEQAADALGELSKMSLDLRQAIGKFNY